MVPLRFHALNQLLCTYMWIIAAEMNNLVTDQTSYANN